MNDIILRCAQITKKYAAPSGTLEVLRGVDMTINKGEICYILGRSGSGKSTLLHILGGLDTPSSGVVTIAGTPLHTLRAVKLAQLRNRRIGFVFQFYYLLPELTVLENVLLPGLINRRNVSKRAHALLDMLGLHERKKHFPRELSGGEQQRVTVARSLINEPDIIFCDEPTGNLDEANAAAIFDLVETLNREQQQSFCIVTHEEGLVRTRKNVYRLKDGVLKQER